MDKQNPDIQREAYNPGDFIFFEGDVDFHFYIIESGEVQIFSKGVDGSRLNIVTIGAGESFGEFALLDRAPRSASAQALGEVIAVKVSQAGYEQLISELPAWANCMLKNFAARLKAMTNTLRSMPQFMDGDREKTKV